MLDAKVVRGALEGSDHYAAVRAQGVRAPHKALGLGAWPLLTCTVRVLDRELGWKKR